MSLLNSIALLNLLFSLLDDYYYQAYLCLYRIATKPIATAIKLAEALNVAAAPL